MFQSHSFGTSTFISTNNGRRLHYMVKGEGSPTVVFESGLGFSRSTWGLVHPAIAKATRAVVYDRAGLGKSEPDDKPRTLARMADDLSCLLDALGPGPFILVGHSWGGPMIRVAASRNLARIRGLILVDPSDEQCDLYFAPASQRQFALNRLLLPPLARLGLYRLLGSIPGRAQPDDVYKEHRREDFTVRSAKTAAAESDSFLTELAALRETPPFLGNTEISIITGTKITWMERKVRPAVMKAHQKSVSALPNGRWVEASSSGHLINFSEPQLIIHEIMGMIH
ncbi:alpha/beta hydrolase [Paenibacillus sp. 79R4]|uniref:alpha/beta fold hydrolase n=1 Tax=Paenibacillus sp. 79R4 TaxID=2212847 RepID=UPI0015C037FE|nr:alpha/beta hydrolase [Paenibacillus sp. 79R4]NWL89493.1 alpha/beta hydrolase [Paenibacillus sp. 79R4]